MEVCSQLLALAASPSENDPRYQWTGGLVCMKAGQDPADEENLLPLLGIQPELLSCPVVAYSLCWLSYHNPNIPHYLKYFTNYISTSYISVSFRSNWVGKLKLILLFSLFLLERWFWSVLTNREVHYCFLWMVHSTIFLLILQCRTGKN